MTKAPKRKLTKAEAGRLGGKTTKERHGRKHYQEAGRKGFMATVARHWHGDRQGYLKWLRANGYLREYLKQAQASGETCIEIPPIAGLEEEDLPW
jgi:general stress protein YciG